MSNPKYDHDFYGWAYEQADLLRKGDFSHLDILNLIEEVESMGRSEKRELRSRLSVLIAHLLNWQYQPAYRGTSWELTIKEQRIKTAEVLSENPSLKPKLDEVLVQAYKTAHLIAQKETGFSANTFPASCPYSIEQLLDESFMPQGDDNG